MIDIANFYKHEIIGVNLSTPFITKNRCKKCASHPAIYYYIRNGYLYIDPRHSINTKYNIIRKYGKRMCSNHSMMIAPKHYAGLSGLSHTPSYKGYLPKFHYSRGRKYKTNVTEFLMCECGETSWAFSSKAIQECPEIINRKSRHKYPQKFEF